MLDDGADEFHVSAPREPIRPHPDPGDRLERSAVARRQRWELAGWIAAGSVVAIALVRMVRVVLSGSDIQHGDYWMMIERFTTPGGGLDVEGLFEFQNHPVVVPQLIYWINIQLFSGSNRTLGLFVCLVVLATIGVLTLIARAGELRPVERMMVVALAGVLLFSLNRSWNFALAMSGTAWLLTNLLVVLAVYLRSSARLFASLLLAVVASVTYGTGIMVWPALLAVGLVLRPWREWWKESFHVVAFLVTFAWYRTGMTVLGVEGTAAVGDYFRQTARIFAYPFVTDGASFILLGWVPTIAIPLLVLWAVLARKTPAVAAWAGIGVFVWCAIAEVTAARGGRYLEVLGDQFRYTALSALGWVALVALVLVAARQATERLASSGVTWTAPLTRPIVPVAIVVPLLAIGWAGGHDQLTVMERRSAMAELTGIAWQLDLSKDANHLLFLDVTGPLTPRLRAMGHHPFVDDWEGLCGLHEETLDSDEAERVVGAGAVVGVERTMFFDGHPMFEGWVDAELGVDCIVVIDPDGSVVGGGLTGPWELKGPHYTEGREMFRGIFAYDADPVTVLAVTDDGATVMIHEGLSMPEGANG